MAGTKEKAMDAVLRPEAREALKRLEIFARRTVDGLLHGAHISRRKGVSTEFDHHKLYQPGDPLKHVDWKASARHERIFVKRYIEDTSLTVRLVADRSGSLGQSTDGVAVFDQCARLTAALAYLVLRQRDSVGLQLAGEAGGSWIPASSTQSQLVRILEALVAARPAGEDALTAALRALADRPSHKGMVVAISDLMFEPEPARRQMSRLQAAGHEVLLIHLRDATAERFPFNRWMLFESLESADRRYRVDAVALKRLYAEEYRAWIDEWEGWARRRDVHLVAAPSHEPAEAILSAYLAHRAKEDA